MKKNLLILGAGQYGQIIFETAEAMDCFDRIEFLDDQNSRAIGKLEEYAMLTDSYDCAFVAMGNPQLRLEWMGKLKEAGYELPTLIHPQGYVSKSAVLSEGCIVEPMAVVQAGAIVEAGSLLCAGCVVNHNSIVKQGCQIDCNAIVPARAIVPAMTKIPCGSVAEVL